MTAVFLHRRGTPTAARGGAGASAAAGLCLIAGLTGLVAGCAGDGSVAPVRSPVEAAVPGRGREHVVGRGDTLYSIAWRLGLDYHVLAGVNSIQEPYTIYPGQRLLIPEPGDSAPSTPEPSAVQSDPTESSDVSTRGTGTTEAPVATPLPPSSPESAQSANPPRQPPSRPRRSVPEPAVNPAADAPPAAPREAPAQRRQSAPEPVSKTTSESPGAARTVAGVRWTRPAGGRTIQGFGRGGNKGIDIEGAFREPVRAAASGRVVYAGSGLVGYGKLVIVKHDSRILSAYAHNENLHVGEGDEVKGGQHIADMGRSGKGRVMLHFEIRRDGKPVDPLRFLP